MLCTIFNASDITFLKGVLGVQRNGQAHLFVWSAFFSLNGMALKNLQKLTKSIENLLIFRIFSEFVQFWLKDSSQNQLDELNPIILLLLTPKTSLESE